MKVLRSAWLSILYFIRTIILTVVAGVIVLGALCGYLSLQPFMFCKGDYLLFVGGDLNMIPAIMIIILIIFVLFRIKERFFNRKEKEADIINENDEPLDIKDLNKLEKFFFKLLNVFLANNKEKEADIIDENDKPSGIEDLNRIEKFLSKLLNAFLACDEKFLKIFKILKISYILVLIVAIYFGMTSYAILYPETIKVGSPIVPSGVVYKYSDIKNVNVGISRGSKNSYSPYYKAIFNDGKSVDLFGATMQESKGVRFEYILIDLDKKLRTQGVVKTVNKENFEKYSKGLDMDFISRVEKLFDDK